MALEGCFAVSYGGLDGIGTFPNESALELVAVAGKLPTVSLAY